MTAHLVILPILIPMVAAVLLLFPLFSRSIASQRQLSLSVLFLVFSLSFGLLQETRSGVLIYMVGDWAMPFGIQLLADRTSSLMVLLTSVLAGASLLYATGGDDNRGKFFHPLFMFQIAGINGAFLTGDLFNLFVFFELLLISSYALLIHGGGKEKTQAGVHYVILNLVGSALFLIALGILYGTYGSLNIADMASKTANLDEGGQALAAAGGLLLLVVFAVKSAALPLQFWLVSTYSSATAPAAALFAILTKVGIYSMLRVHLQLFGDTAGELAQLIQPWLWPMALATVIFGAVGVIASSELRHLASNLVVVSMGLLLSMVSIGSQQAISAALYYTLHTTLVTGLLFLLADMIGRSRGAAGDQLISASPMVNQKYLAGLFLVAAISVAGMPPLSGFVGKVLMMASAEQGWEMVLFWSALIISSFAAIIAVARAGIVIFWNVREASQENVAITQAILSSREVKEDPSKFNSLQWMAVILLCLMPILLALFADAMIEFTDAAAQQLHGLRVELSEVPLP